MLSSVDLLKNVVHKTNPPVVRPLRVACQLTLMVGGAFVIWSGAIHLQRWGDGYSSIETIGPLFLMQGIVSIVLGLAIVVTRHPLLALGGAGMMVATIVGLLWSVNYGLFGFQDSFSSPSTGESLIVEAVGAGLLVVPVVLTWALAGKLRPHTDNDAESTLPAAGGVRRVPQ